MSKSKLSKSKRKLSPFPQICRFAPSSQQCDNACMPKSPTFTLFAAGVLLLGTAVAQQSTTGAKPAPSTSAQSSTATKTHSSSTTTHTAAPLTTNKEKFSYALGMSMGKTLHRDGVEVEPALVMQGLKDTLAGGKTRLTDEEAQAAFTAIQGQVKQKMEAQRQEAGQTNNSEGAAFLAANKTKPGVIALPSGLQYKILKEGTGPKPAATDTVTCAYRGTLINGTEFDSSAKHGHPLSFPVNGVIKGWTEALQLMPVGSKWELFIPPDLAYGARGAGDDIGPNQTLIFEVELLSIDKNEKKPAESGPAK